MSTWRIAGLLVVVLAFSCARRDEAKHVELGAVPVIVATPRAMVRPAPADAAWCERLTHENAVFIGPRRFDEDAGCLAPELACVASDAGAAWGFVVREAHASKDDPICSTTTHVEVARSDGLGAISPALADAGLELSQSAQGEYRWQREHARVQLLGDLDGDGDEEVLVTRTWWAHEEGSGAASRVWTTKGRNVVPYAATRALVIVEARDVDHDGRADFVTRGPYEGIEAQSQLSDVSFPVGPDIFLVHALADGHLSTNDATVLAFARAQCRERSTSKQLAIVCGRLRGESEAEVLDEQRREGCVDFDEDETRYPQSCEKWLPELARVTPPFVLPK